VLHIPSLADFDYYFLFVGWWQWAAAAASAVASIYGSNKSARVSQQNAREQRAWQTQMSNTAHTREISDLKNAGLNPILSSKNAGAPTGAGAMAQTPDYAKSYGSGVANALMIAQTRKTNAEATLVEDQKNRAQLESDFYGSVAGMPTVAAKTLGGAGTAYGTYRAAKALKNMYKSRKKSSKPVISRPSTKFKRVKNSKHVYVIDKRTGESKRVFRRSKNGGGVSMPGRGSFRHKTFRRF
jgi:hypothetical protein